jgi:hypothetical protein
MTIQHINWVNPIEIQEIQILRVSKEFDTNIVSVDIIIIDVNNDEFGLRLDVQESDFNKTESELIEVVQLLLLNFEIN